MEEHAYHLEYVIVLMIGVEATVPYVCESCISYVYSIIMYCFVIQLYVLLVASMVETALHLEYVHVLMDGLVMTVVKV